MADEDELVWDREFDGRVAEEELELAYRALHGDSASALALRAVEAVERSGSERARAVKLLARVSCYFPEALAGLHGRLLDAEVFSSFMYPYVLQLGVMFRSADAESRDRLRALVAQTTDWQLGDHAAGSLAWVDDVEVPPAFLEFHKRVPPWGAEFGFSAVSYGWRAGWALLGSGEARPLLLSDRCRRIERKAEPNSPVAVISRVEESCGGCAGPLTDLLDIDLSDRRLQLLGAPGQRLRVLSCERCVCFGSVYARVDLAGHARWLEHSPQLRDPPEWAYLPERQLGLSDERRTPFEAHALGIHMSQLGGQAGWIQDPDYPECPRCQQPMPFLGQLDLSEFELMEGMIYAFFDPGCGIIATVFQQT